MSTHDGTSQPSSGSLLYLTLVCLVATLGGLLFGYDTAVISGAIGFLQTHFNLDPTMKGWAAASALLGCALGAALAGPISDGSHWKNAVRLWGLWLLFFLCGYLAHVLLRPHAADIVGVRTTEWIARGIELCLLTLLVIALAHTVAIFAKGRRTVLILAAILFLVSAIGTALPRTLNQFIVFRFIGGLGVGAASITSPMYIAEISPARIRGRMVSVNQLAIVTGILAVYFVNYFIEGWGDEVWNVHIGWRWMFGSEALPALLLLVLLFFVPESPRWLTKQGRIAEAHCILTRVDGPEHADREMVEIKGAIEHESGSVMQLLQPGMRIVLVIGIALAVLQQITGINVFLYYGPEIFKGVAGAKMDAALLQTIVIGSVNLTFTIVAIWTVDWLGRKPLMIIGAAGMGISLTALGLAAYYQHVGAWLLIFMLGYIASFAIAVGPVTWVILSEIFPTKIRGSAMAIATFCLWLANFVVSQTFPMMDEHPWLVEKFHHGFPFWIYAAFCAVLVLFMWRAVPETKGKTLEEIEKHWVRK